VIDVIEDIIRTVLVLKLFQMDLGNVQHVILRHRLQHLLLKENVVDHPIVHLLVNNKQQ
jgi:hypothetical protein